MKRKILLSIILISVIAFVSADYPFYESEDIEPRIIEAENYRFHLVESHGTTGGELEPLVRVDEGEKRDMVIALDTRQSPREICSILYTHSRTVHSQPCNQLP